MKGLGATSTIALWFKIGHQHPSFPGSYHTHHTELSDNSGKQYKMTKKIQLGSVWILELQPFGLKSKCLLIYHGTHPASFTHTSDPAPQAVCYRYIDPERVILVMLEAVATGLQRNAKSHIMDLLNIQSQVLSWCKLTELHGNKPRKPPAHAS